MTHLGYKITVADGRYTITTQLGRVRTFATLAQAKTAVEHDIAAEHEFWRDEGPAK